MRHLYSIPLWITIGWLLGGCSSAKPIGRPAVDEGGERIAVLSAVCYPPRGWSIEPMKESAKHHHQVWISPGGETAYGVIHFSLPIPMTADLALWGFLREMKRTEGSADLIDKQSIAGENALLFEAQGGIYRVRGILKASGWEGWAAYAGTRADKPISPEELETAIRARDSTRFEVR